MEMSSDGRMEQPAEGMNGRKGETDVLPARRRAVRPHGCECCCCCTASATATICFAFTLGHSHLLTHALFASASFNPPPFSPLIPPSFHHLLPAIRPSLRPGFPISASASLRLIFLSSDLAAALTAPELFCITCASPLTCLLTESSACSGCLF